jgi:hypothetical protein
MCVQKLFNLRLPTFLKVGNLHIGKIRLAEKAI